MYPAREVLEEIGRITIAGARLDWQCAHLLHHLDPAAEPLERTRPLAGRVLTERLRKRAQERLEGSMRASVLLAADDADAARRERNDLVHGEWVLRGSDSARPVAEIAPLVERGAANEVETYFRKWQREAKPSADWLRMPSRSLDLEPPPALPQLVDLELRLGGLAARPAGLRFRVRERPHVPINCGTPGLDPR